MKPRFGRAGLRLALALGSLIATRCFAAAPLETVRACATGASAGLYGLKNLSAVCPDLQAALGSLGLDKILYEGWQGNLNVHALHDVLNLHARYSRPSNLNVLDTSGVPGILQSLKDERAAPGMSWWRSFENWIKQWLKHSDSSIAKWIKHLLEDVLGSTKISSGFVRAFVHIVTIFAALSALAIVVYELHAAGFVDRYGRKRAATNAAEESASRSVTDEESPAHENTPAGVLRALVKRLLQTGRLASERSLTHRELIARTAFDSEGQKSAFAQVSRCAEGILYGAEPAATAVAETVTRQGRELLQQLSATASTP